MQSVPITTNFASSNLHQARCTWYNNIDKVGQWRTTGRWFSPCTPVSSINKTDRHEITQILLKHHKPPPFLTMYLWLFFLSVFVTSQCDVGDDNNDSICKITSPVFCFRVDNPASENNIFLTTNDTRTTKMSRCSFYRRK